MEIKNYYWGEKTLWLRENYKNSILEGERKMFRFNGEKKEWYENGKLYAQENYKNGQLEGEVKYGGITDSYIGRYSIELGSRKENGWNMTVKIISKNILSGWKA